MMNTINSWFEDDLSAQTLSFEIWLRGVPEEIRFWDNYLRTKGSDYGSDFAFRLSTDTQIRERDDILAETLLKLGLPQVHVLDVGSGPLTNLGKTVHSINVNILPCDPLADVYKCLLDRYAISPPIPTQFADAENLSAFFEINYFDAVHCANALDHSYNPLNGLIEMLKVVKPSGFVQLGHWDNEAVYEKYSGLHQWNISEHNGDLLIWSQDKKIALKEQFGHLLDVNVKRIPVKENSRDWILAQIRKRSLIEELLSSKKSSLMTKYNLVCSKLGKNIAQSNIKDSDELAKKYRDSINHFFLAFTNKFLL